MSKPLAAYSFLSWARQGLGMHTQDAPAGKLRGEVAVSVLLRGEKVGGGQATESFQRNVALYGPGDVIGIDARAIVRSEPRSSIMNFEPNYLAFIEFYDEDFVWRYTPAAPSSDKKRLTPWLTLVVLEEGEFEDQGVVSGTPLPRFQLKGTTTAQVFPSKDELWAWAHVHIDGTLNGIGLGDTEALGAYLGATVAANRDLAYSRLICPRRLEPSKTYRGFVIPTYESGRLAGLGDDPAAAGSATKSAWENPATAAFPYYYSWRFATSTVGDFEYLVRLLKPQPANSQVGVRDMDLQDAGSGVGSIEKPDLDNILKLGGALRVPHDFMPPEAKLDYEKFDTWARTFPRPFQTRLANLLNLPDDYLKSGASQDPVIVPPLYGRWHAAIERVLDGPLGDPEQSRERWIHELNLDPRYRAAAGIGTNIVQKNQEDYVEAAWQQVGRVIEGNKKVRHAQFSLFASLVWNTQNLAPLVSTQSSKFLTLSAPLHGRVLADGISVGFRVQDSTVPAAAMSKVMRQALRPRARVAKRIGFDATRTADNLVDRLSAGEVVAAPPKVVPPILPTGDQMANAMQPAGIPAWLADMLKKNPWLRWLPLAVAILLALVLLLFGAGILALVVAAMGAGLSAYLGRATRTAAATDTLRDGGLTAAAVDALPSSPDFHIYTPGAGPAPTIGGSDSEDARRFKIALRDAARVELAESAIKLPVRQPLQIGALVTTVGAALHPAKTIPAWVRQHVSIPDRIRDQMVDADGEIMVYPEIDIPMYKPLSDLSSELFLPNIQFIDNNSITLLETNQKFIEAYMVGVNHEFARELLWREYPTDRRGSYFRQFWDASSCLVPDATDIDAQRERLRDITRIHTWKPPERLDDHDNRELLGDKEDELVLVIRGELLKKYPNAIIYAHRAAWERVGDKPTGAIDKTRPRKLKDLTAAQEDAPPRSIVKTPLYDAAVQPDIYFFGFDITVPKAFNETDPDLPNEEGPGWFFVIKERPGEPRFGLDIERKGALNTWNDLAWNDVGTVAGASLTVGAQQDYSLADPGGTEQDSPAKKQYVEDARFRWRKATEAAELAYILYQVPVLISVHAAEMLPKRPQP